MLTRIEVIFDADSPNELWGFKERVSGSIRTNQLDFLLPVQVQNTNYDTSKQHSRPRVSDKVLLEIQQPLRKIAGSEERLHTDVSGRSQQ